MNIRVRSFYRTGRWILMTGLLIMIINSAKAQEKSKFLSLKDAIAASTSDNNQVQSDKIDEAIAKEKYLQSDAGFLPQVNFSYSALYSDNPLNVFGFKLQERGIGMADFSPDKMNHPSATSDFTTKVELMQPVFNMDAGYAKKSAFAQLESTRLKSRRSKEYLDFQTRKTYRMLQQTYQAAEVLEEALETAKAAYEFTDNRYKQGLLQESDLMNMRVQVLNVQSELDDAKASIANISDVLSVLMNKTLGTVYKAEKNDEVSVEPETQVNIPESRADFLAIEKGKEALGLMLKSTKMKYVPRLNAFGSYQFDDKKLLGFNSNSYLAGIQLTWNIFDGNQNRRQAAQLKLQQDQLDNQLKSLRQQNALELEKSYRDLANARSKIKAQKAAVEQSEEALRVLQNRYREGLVNTTDILRAQTQVMQQKLKLTTAVFNRQVTLDYIHFLTESDTIQ